MPNDDTEIKRLMKDAGWTQARFDSVMKFHSNNRDEAVTSLRKAVQARKGNPYAGQSE